VLPEADLSVPPEALPEEEDLEEVEEVVSEVAVALEVEAKEADPNSIDDDLLCICCLNDISE
jgi:hypothetical protein